VGKPTIPVVAEPMENSTVTMMLIAWFDQNKDRASRRSGVTALAARRNVR
jgi:hypothetical protein